MTDLNLKTVLLYSGGMDSYALKAILKPDVSLYVNLGTRYSEAEISRLPKDVLVVDFPGLTQFERPDGIIPLRNLILVSIATNFGNQIALGATAGDRVLDKSEKFARDTSALCNFLWNDYWSEGKVIVVTLPFKGFTKTQIIAEYIKAGYDPLELAHQSFSCYSPILGKPCGQCKPCFRKWVAFKLNGIDIAPSSRDYIITNILPLIKNGTYNRKDEEAEILHAIE